MTIKRKNKETGEIEEQPLSIRALVMGTAGFRALITILVLSMHPMGRGLLHSVGFQFEDQKKIEVAADQASSVSKDVSELRADMKEIQKDVQALKANGSILNARFDQFEQTFTGFRVDFQKYRQPQPDPSK